MADLVAAVRYYYHDLWQAAAGDPRVNSFPLMSGGPWTTLAIVLAYVYIVKVAGPRWMKGRPAFDLRNVIRLYNVALVFANLYFFVNFWQLTRGGRETLFCSPPNPYDNNTFKLRIGWWFLISKFVDLFDTLFFVLRKKQSHVSLLHVAHHALMPINIWLGLKLIPTLSAALIPLINSLVHAIMYSYYAASTWPALRPYLWWKRYLTQIQIIQIGVGTLHLAFIGFNPACAIPRFLSIATVAQATFILALFILFYLKSYRR